MRASLAQEKLGKRAEGMSTMHKSILEQTEKGGEKVNDFKPAGSGKVYKRKSKKRLTVIKIISFVIAVILAVVICFALINYL
jgi:hypothetical protein